MEFPGADAGSPAVKVDIDSLAAFAERLRGLTAMAGRADAAAYGARSADFAGSGPPAALWLRDVNAAGLCDLAQAVARLDGAVGRLRDAADDMALSYADADASAAAEVASAGYPGRVISDG
jgi:hypothetical protein